MDEYITYQTITQWRVRIRDGKVEHLKGFTRPIGGTSKGSTKSKPKQLDIGDIDEEVLL